MSTSKAIEPSVATVIYETEHYLSFPAIISAGGRLVAIFRQAAGNPLDFDSRLLITHSDDDGQSWSPAETWVDLPDVDSRNCGGAVLDDGEAHFVYDLHGGGGAWRRPYVQFTRDGRQWSEPIRLQADLPGRGDEQLTSVGNHGVRWFDGRIYFPHFMGKSVLLDRQTGRQEQTHTVPRIEPQVEINCRGELVSFAKGGPVDISPDRGVSWLAETQLLTISQPDLITLRDGRLLFCYSGKVRQDEWLILSEDGRDLQTARKVKIFEGTADDRIDSRGKAMALEHGEEILTILYEAASASRGPSRIYLVRTPKAGLV
jgi:hypothetical protein